MALEAIHTGFYFHNDFLMQFQSYVNSFGSCGSCLFFCYFSSIYCLWFLSTVCLFLMSPFRSWNYQLGIQFPCLVPGYFWLIYQLFRPTSFSFVFWSSIAEAVLDSFFTLVLYFLSLRREWLFYWVWLNNMR